jgi:hypothetical protein
MPSECVAWQAVFSAVGLADANDCMDMLLDPCGCFRVVCANGHITELNMNALALTGTLPPELGRLTELQVLAMSNNQLHGTLPVEIANVAAMRDFGVGNNQLTGHLPDGLWQLTKLTGLSVISNELSGTVSGDIAKLTGLARLYMAQNHFTGTVPQQLAQLSKLELVMLGINDFDGLLPQLPFQQYTTRCFFGSIPFVCPLPSNASYCKDGLGQPTCSNGTGPVACPGVSASCSSFDCTCFVSKADCERETQYCSGHGSCERLEAVDNAFGCKNCDGNWGGNTPNCSSCNIGWSKQKNCAQCSPEFTLYDGHVCIPIGASGHSTTLDTSTEVIVAAGVILSIFTLWGFYVMMNRSILRHFSKKYEAYGIM